MSRKLKQTLDTLWIAFKFLLILYLILIVLRLFGFYVRVPVIDELMFIIFDFILSLFGPGQDWARRLFSTPL